MDKPYQDPILARDQELLVELLFEFTTIEELHAQISRLDLSKELKEWLLQSDHDMLETSASLVKKWGSKDPLLGVGISRNRDPKL